jgi:putative acetyltransferase
MKPEPTALVIRDAAGPADIAIVRALFERYAQSLNFSLCFQGFDRELAGLPGDYARPRGRLLIAWLGPEAAGVVGLRPLSDEICEMKRLYVPPERRGHGIGEALVDRVIAEARAIGYRAMRLDTVPATMAKAIALYRARGFRSIPAYYDVPVAEMEFMELALDPA